MNLAVILAAISLPGTAPEPVLWMKLDGSIQVYVHSQTAALASPARLQAGVSVVSVPGGVGYDFHGVRSGIMVPDVPSLRLMTSMSISCWIKLRSYVDRGPGAQILFRGDDRAGLDPYQLTILADGTVHFDVTSAPGQFIKAAAPVALNRWTHVLGTLDSRMGRMSLWIDGKEVASSSLKGLRPIVDLDIDQAPGVGIGNIQNDRGPHNQPLNGTLTDLRVYSQVVTPEQAGFSAAFGGKPQ